MKRPNFLPHEETWSRKNKVFKLARLNQSFLINSYWMQSFFSFGTAIKKLDQKLPDKIYNFSRLFIHLSLFCPYPNWILRCEVKKCLSNIYWRTLQLHVYSAKYPQLELTFQTQLKWSKEPDGTSSGGCRDTFSLIALCPGSCLCSKKKKVCFRSHLCFYFLLINFPAPQTYINFNSLIWNIIQNQKPFLIDVGKKLILALSLRSNLYIVG